jgi:hypothetical protein
MGRIECVSWCHSMQGATKQGKDASLVRPLANDLLASCTPRDGKRSEPEHVTRPGTTPDYVLVVTHGSLAAPHKLTHPQRTRAFPATLLVQPAASVAIRTTVFSSVDPLSQNIISTMEGENPDNNQNIQIVSPKNRSRHNLTSIPTTPIAESVALIVCCTQDDGPGDDADSTRSSVG